MEIWQYRPDLAVPIRVGKSVLESRAVSGAKKHRVKSGKARTLELRFENRDDAEWQAADEFWDAHYPGVQFWYEDWSYVIPRGFVAEIISELQHVTNGYNDRSYSFQILEIPGPELILDGELLTWDGDYLVDL